MDGIEGLEARGYLSDFGGSGGIIITNPQPYDVEQVLGRKNRFDEILVTADPRRASKVLVTVNGVGRKFAPTSRLRLEIVARGADDRGRRIRELRERDRRRRGR
jgi:hypothetical protein